MAKGFLNLNRFKHGRMLKRDSKQKASLSGKKKVKGKVFKLSP